jgi:iron-sulfur cluster assembly protein
MAITLTEVAADRVRSFLDNRGKGVGLRLGIKTHGCSGMAYVMDFAKEGLNEGFKFTNPNESGECGCGESFTV